MEQMVKGLRALADFLEANPDLPESARLTVDIWVWNKNDFREAARKMGHAEKIETNHLFALRKTFSDKVVIDLNTTRDVVCTKVVVGKEYVEEIVVPAHEREIVEWRCEDPVLA